jgi:hypothetical protein
MKTCQNFLFSFILLSLWWPCGYGTAWGAGPIRVSDQFESGSLGNWRLGGNTRLLFIPKTDFDQDQVNTAVTWFYGRLENVAQREVRIEVTGLECTVYNGKKGDILPFQRGTVPVFSYDREHWQRFTDCTFDLAARTFKMRQIFSEDTVWVAYTIPYTFSRLEGLLKEIETNPAVTVETLGRSAEARPLYLVTVAEPGTDSQKQPVVWIVARQHAFEAGGSWSVEGLLRFLISDNPEATRIRRQITFKLCPMLNPDGVVHGGTRFNARGVDLNRHWHSSDPLSSDLKMAPEITLVKQALRNWHASHRLDLWINIHNNDMVWNEDGDYIRFAAPGGDVEARKLEAFLREETVYTGPFQLSSDEHDTDAVVAANTGALSLLIEMKTGYLESLDRWTGQDIWLNHGRGLARAAARFLENR